MNNKLAKQMACTAVLIAVGALGAAGARPAKSTRKTELSGSMLKAVIAAWSRLQKDPQMNEARSHLENYSIRVSKHGHNFEVLFVIARLGKRPGLGSVGEFGLERLFEVSPSGKIVRATIPQ